VSDGLALTTSAADDAALREQLIAGLDAGLPGDMATFDRVPLAVALRDRQGRLVGGLAGCSLFGWLVVELLWVDPAARGVGHGRRLLAAAEAEALRRGCHHARVNTYSFQAPGFYERCGYALAATLADSPRGHQRHTFVKALV
jgi:GNAT superfamily N-acetyltransferase